jgi:transcriptional regulator with XRE-family HTH domain
VPKHRARRARERAGLSVEQAGALLGLKQEHLLILEDLQAVFDNTDLNVRVRMADYYGVNYEWLTGEVPLYDFEAVDKIKGVADLSFHDRDILAEFAAALPLRKPGPP